MPPGSERDLVAKAEEIVAIQTAAALGLDILHIVNVAKTITFAGVLVVFICTAAYPFQPQQMLLVFSWITLGIVLSITSMILIQMDRDPTLSGLTGTTPSQVTFDRTFATKLLAYTVLPLLSAVVTRFPQVTNFAQMLLRVVRGG